jgi:hypothetical protein
METSLINEPFKLQHPVAGFTFFTADQVLTADHLNQFIHYLTYQERQTRAWLTGSGIICGLEITLEKHFIRISKGCGLSSDGDLFSLPADLLLSHSAPFADGNAKYPFLQDTGEILELAPDDKINDSVLLNEEILKDKIIVFYLESYVKQPDFCTTENCDNQGKTQHHQFHILLLPRGKKIALPPSIPELAFTLPEVYATRPEIQKGNIQQLEDSAGKSGLQSRFTLAIAASQKALISALEQVKNEPAFASIIGPNNLTWVSQLITGPDPAVEIPGLQNIHAFYQDICQAYREWRDSLSELTHSCTPEFSAHPKHLLLGEATTTPDHPPHPYRHRFISAGTFSVFAPCFKRSKLLWQRMSDLTTAFNATRKNPPKLESLKILPTRDPNTRLGNRTRPAYYGDSYTGLWDVDAYLSGNLRPPLSYTTASSAAFANCGWETSFYRIEGHLGKPLKEIEAQLKALRREHNLSFEILAIQIEDDPEFAIPRRHRFFDLETAYHHQRTHLNLQLRDVESFGSVINDALHLGADRIPKDDISIKLPAAQSAAKGAATHANTAMKILPGKLSELSNQKVIDFSLSYSHAIADSHIVNQNISTIAAQVQTTPMDRFVQPEVSAKWKIWHDLLQNRRRQVAQLSTFEKFVDANPGLEHHGGVPRGGTLILVYSASKDEALRTVKADFCLPYFSHFDLHSLEEIQPVEPDVPTPLITFIPPIWKKNYDWTVATLTPVSVKTLVNDRSLILETKLTTSLKGDIQQSFAGINLLSGIMKVPQVAKEMPVVVEPGTKNMVLDSTGRQMRANREEIIKLKEQLAGNPTLPDLGILIGELEVSNALLTEKGLTLVAEEAVAADLEKRPIDAGQAKFFDIAFSEAAKLETPAAQTVIKDATRTLGDQNPGNGMIAGNLGRFNGMFGH